MKTVETLCFTRPVRGALPYVWGMDSKGKEVFFRTLKPTPGKPPATLFQEILENEVLPAGLEWKNPPHNWLEILESD